MSTASEINLLCGAPLKPGEESALREVKTFAEFVAAKAVVEARCGLHPRAAALPLPLQVKFQTYPCDWRSKLADGIQAHGAALLAAEQATPPL